MLLFHIQDPRPYNFGYDIKDEESYSDFSFSEKSDGNVVSGSYRVVLPDGRTQIVNYRADKNGNVATVTYEGEAKYPEWVEPDYNKPTRYVAPVYTQHHRTKLPLMSLKDTKLQLPFTPLRL